MSDMNEWLREQWFIEYCIFSFAIATKNLALARKVAATLKAMDRKLHEDNGQFVPRLVTSITKGGEVIDTITTTFVTASRFRSTSAKGDYALEVKFGMRLTRKVEQRALSGYGIPLRLNPGIIRDHD